MKRTLHPIDSLIWIHRDLVRTNDYNPNSQVGANHELLIESMKVDGWTQPIVVRPPNRDGIHVIVDGEHRWRASKYLDNPLVPVVILDQDDAGCIAATVRHNRARGSHGVDHMLHIILKLREEGQDDEAIEQMLGMSPEERTRLEMSEDSFLAMMAGTDKSMET